MDFHIKKRRTIIKYIQTTIMSPNGQLVLLARDKWNVLIYSKLQSKKLWNFSIESKVQQFSPSSQYLAFGGYKGQLSVIKLGSHTKVYNHMFGQFDLQYIIKYIRFQSENILLAVSFFNDTLFKVDLQNKTTQKVTLFNIRESCFSYGQQNDIILLVESKIQFLQIYSAKDCQKLFQSEKFSRQIYGIQLIDEKNLVLLDFVHEQQLYEINYIQQKFKQIQQEVPQSIFGSSDIILCRDYIITLAQKDTQIKNSLTIQFNKLGSPETISKTIPIPSNFIAFQSFYILDQSYLTIQAQYMQKYQNFILIRYFIK